MWSVWVLVLTMAFVTSSLALKNESFRERPECAVWSHLERRTLPLQNAGHANCTTNKACTGFHCVGLYLSQPIVFGMRLLPCEQEVGVEVYGSAPQFHAHNFTHIFTHDEEYAVPGALLNITLGSSESEVEGRVRVHLERSNDNDNNVIIGLEALGYVNETQVFRKAIFKPTPILMPLCVSSNHPTETRVGEEAQKRKEEGERSRVSNEVCELSELNACGLNMMCEQSEPKSNIGLCTCLRGFAKLKDGTCGSLKRPSVPTMSEEHQETLKTDMDSSSLSVSRMPRRSSSSPSRGSSGLPLLALSSLVLLVLVVASALVFLGLRTRVFHRIRARFTHQPYEDIVIGRQQRPQAQSSHNVFG